jgi:hypothetical protein
MHFYNLPVVFISYHEPNAEDNFVYLRRQNLKNVGRVIDVKGFDAAHKKALEVAVDLDSKCTHFLTVDGDTQVMSWAFEEGNTDLLPFYQNPTTFYSTTYSWKSINTINGLAYGNGSLKLWARRFVETMQTHENHNGKGTGNVDFCWDENYIPMEAITSYTYVNSTPEQAWRAGFREGAKLLLDKGQVPGKFELGASDHNMLNARRFVQWASVGRHARHGVYAMLGALQGFLYVHEEKHPVENIADYDFMSRMWKTDLVSFSPADADVWIDTLRRKAAQLLGLHIPTFGPQQSQSIVNMLYHRRSPIGKREEWQFWSCDPSTYR